MSIHKALSPLVVGRLKERRLTQTAWLCIWNIRVGWWTLSCVCRLLESECCDILSEDPTLKTRLRYSWNQDTYQYAEEDECLYRWQNSVACNPHIVERIHPSFWREPRSMPMDLRQAQQIHSATAHQPWRSISFKCARGWPRNCWRIGRWHQCRLYVQPNSFCPCRKFLSRTYHQILPRGRLFSLAD